MKKSHIIKIYKEVLVMLIRFSVENFLSFNQRQVFSMAAGKHTRHKEQLVVVNGKRV